jgi:membrane associated rhomboid family serine protease
MIQGGGSDLVPAPVARATRSTTRSIRTVVHQAVPAGNGERWRPRRPGHQRSQFFITVGTPTHLQGKHTIFGEVADEPSRAVVDSITATPTDRRDRPDKDVVIERSPSNAGDHPAAGGDAEAEPVCPRHPTVVSYVKCQRCMRPHCPACQRPAAVGIQCVDCVRKQARGVRVARTAFGGRVADSDRPWVTQSIIGLCVVVALLQRLPNSTVTTRFEFVPALASAEPWRLLTSCSCTRRRPLHAHPAQHVRALADRPVPGVAVRPVRFALLYLVSARRRLDRLPATGQPHRNNWFGVGDSVRPVRSFGLFGAYFVAQRRLERDSAPLVGGDRDQRHLRFLPGTGVAWQAHLGGLVTGVLIAGALAYAPRTNRTPIQFAGLAAIAVLLRPGVRRQDRKRSGRFHGLTGSLAEARFTHRLWRSLGTSFTDVIPQRWGTLWMTIHAGQTASSAIS